MNGIAQEILAFWKNSGPKGWFSKDDAMDAQIRQRFAGHRELAIAGNLKAWTGEPDTCLALVILLDQFSRNMFRGDARAFSGDCLALETAKDAIAEGFHLRVDPALQNFFFLPFMHSEEIAEQRTCVKLQHANGGSSVLNYAIQHRRIIERFGRFPHRNPALGRATTPAERAFLDDGGFKG